MTQPIHAFRPINSATVSLEATITTSNVALVQDASTYLVTNEGGQTTFIAFGDSTVTATVPNGATGGSMPVTPLAVQVFRAGVTRPTHVAAITAADTATVYVTPGEGY